MDSVDQKPCSIREHCVGELKQHFNFAAESSCSLCVCVSV